MLHADAHLFTGLPDGRLGRRFTHVDGAAHDVPAVLMTGLLDQQQASCLVYRKQRDGWQQQQFVPDDGSQPCDVRSYTHVRNPPIAASDSRASAVAARRR